MGLFGGDSTTVVRTENTTKQFDERIGAADSATVIQLQDGASLELSDEGTISTAESAFDAFGAFAKDAFGFASTELKNERDLVGQSLKLVEARTQSETSNLAGQGLSVLMVVGLAVAALMLAPKFAPKFLR
jgi:hypothetical protein